ncbi:MAG: laminin B domain-containing protein [Planctomycetota bacterium]
MKRAKRLATLAATAAMIGLAIISARCDVSSGPGWTTIEFEIGGKTFAITFGDVGRIQTRANQKVSQAGSLRPFEQTPTDVPSWGQMTLLSSDVTVTPLSVNKSMVRAAGEPINGTANVRISIASGTSADLCDQATLMADFDLTVVNNVATIATETADLSAAAMTVLLTNEVTACIDVTADFDALLELKQFSLKFGPSATGGATAGFTFRNDDIENIHFLLPGETFGSDNRVTPGGTRTATLSGVQVGDTITIQAGRNGTVLADTDCPTVTGTDYEATVVWNGFSLTCSADQGGGGGVIQVPIDSSGDATAVTDTVNGIDYGIVGVLEVSSPQTPLAANPSPSSLSVDLAELGLEYVDTVYLATQSAHAWDIPNGVKVATFYCEYADGGPPTTLDMIMGQNTAEWGYENPSQLESMGGPVSHSQPPIVKSVLTSVDSDTPYWGHMFAASVRLTSSRTLVGMRIELEDAQTVANTRTPPNPDFLLLTQAYMAITLEGPAGTPPVHVECTSDAHCDPGEVCENGQCVVSQPGGAFAITNVEYPTSAVSGGERGDLTVTWSGDPVFPVQIVYRLAGICPSGLTCETPTMTFSTEQNPLVFPDAVYCYGISTEIVFDYEVVMIDARDVESDPYPAPFTCEADGGAGPAGAASSTFDTDDEGWLVYGDAQGGGGPATYNSSGGNPGGCVSANDDAAGGVWYFQAPENFHGDFSNAYGKTLTFDLKQSGDYSQFDGDDVILTGGGITIRLNNLANPATTWTSYSVSLTESAGWLRDGNPATQADMTTVLSLLSDLLIRGEYIVGGDTGWLDSVVLHTE